MKRHYYFTISFLLFNAIFLPTLVVSQRTCGTYNYYLEETNRNPRFKESSRKIEEFTRSAMSEQEKMIGGILTIPVHVIVVYASALQNISDVQIQSQISVLNEDFRKHGEKAIWLKQHTLPFLPTTI
jgi:hypothetical protein